MVSLAGGKHRLDSAPYRGQSIIRRNLTINKRLQLTEPLEFPIRSVHLRKSVPPRQSPVGPRSGPGKTTGFLSDSSAAPVTGYVPIVTPI